MSGFLAGLDSILSIGTNILNKRLDQNNAMELAAHNQGYNREMWHMMNGRQDSMNLNSILIQKHALEKAGFNPALALGGASYSGNVTPMAPANASSVPTQAPNVEFLSKLAGIQSLKLQQEELRSKQLDNDAKARELRREADYDEYLDDRYRQSRGVYDSLFAPIFDGVSGYTASDRVNAQGYKAVSKGTFQAFRDSEEADASSSEASTRITESKLKNKIAQYQSRNSAIVEALYNAPLKVQEHISKTIEKLGAEVSDLRYQNELKQGKEFEEWLNKASGHGSSAKTLLEIIHFIKYILK